MTTSVGVKKVSCDTRGSDLRPMRISTLKFLPELKWDLYIVSDPRSTPILFSSAESPVIFEDLEKLEDRGICDVFLSSEDYTDCGQELRSNLEELLQREDIPSEQRCVLLQAAVSVEIEKAFCLIKVDAAVEQAHEIGKMIANLVSSESVVPSALFGVMRHDFYTFTHITNVSSYGLLLAQHLGISDPKTLDEIAVGGLLHDVGKRLIPPAILNKPGRLTAEEFALIKEHPQRGYEDVCERDDLLFEQKMMVYQHHERIDGGGYPVGLVGDEIHPWGRLCAVVDVFDAISSERPYRKAMEVDKVLEIMDKDAGKHLDKEMVKCWKSAMKQR
ncbi:MAG: metal-dependent phosphohydrolase [Blastopirellula sp.]|nr:MAG: metal-dependent phosphohydrolase [Blastopirellula sp.]